MRKSALTRRLTVCILSPHPLVLREFQRVLARPGFHPILRQLETTLPADLGRLAVPRAAVYVVDAHAPRSASAALVSNILDRKSVVVGKECRL